MTIGSFDPIKVAIVNDYDLVVQGLATMLAPYRREIAVVELDAGREPARRVDVALYDTYGRPKLGLDRIAALLASPNVARVAVYTWELPEDEREVVLRSGVGGLLAKSTSAPELVLALRRIARGECVVSEKFSDELTNEWPGQRFGLTIRESEVAALLAQGLSNREIAETLFVSENTVKSHLKAIFAKTLVTTRSQAIVRITSDAGFRRRVA